MNVDGNANRVAAITFGPASVILVVGSNKIVKDLAAADARVKAVAAPANAKRLSCKTPCAVTGQCENCQMCIRDRGFTVDDKKLKRAGLDY